MPKLTETFAGKLPSSKEGTGKFWDTEIKGFVLFVGKRSETWYYQRDVGGQTRRVLNGRYPLISEKAARQTVLRAMFRREKRTSQCAMFNRWICIEMTPNPDFGKRLSRVGW